jgi:hypothetical protein
MALWAMKSKYFSKRASPVGRSGERHYFGPQATEVRLLFRDCTSNDYSTTLPYPSVFLQKDAFYWMLYDCSNQIRFMQ